MGHDQPLEQRRLNAQGRLEHAMAKAAHDFDDEMGINRCRRIQVSDQVVETRLIQVTRVDDEIDQFAQRIWKKALVIAFGRKRLDSGFDIGTTPFCRHL